MAAGVAAEPTNASAVTKDAAMSFCRAAMSKMVSGMCGSGNLYTLNIPDGMEAGDVAAAVGGAIVSTGSVVVGGVTRRIVTVRIAVGLLMATTVAETAPAQLIRIEQTASDLGISRVTVPIFKAPAAARAGSSVMPEIAQAINKTAPIIGDSLLIKAVSVAAAEFNVIGYALQILAYAQTIHSGEFVRAENNVADKTCCDCATSAFNAAWDKAPDTFHQLSYKTRTGVKRFYGKRATRR